jgi:hypothetical protein
VGSRFRIGSLFSESKFVIHVPTRGQNRAFLIFFGLSLEASLLTKLAFTHTMVQGTTEGLQSKATPNNARRAHKAAANTKKGRRTAAPKKAAAIKQATMHKVGPRSFFFFLSLYSFQHHPFSRTPD